jgi:hypothetical protein
MVRTMREITREFEKNQKYKQDGKIFIVRGGVFYDKRADEEDDSE